jgi:hypothetical protein
MMPSNGLNSTWFPQFYHHIHHTHEIQGTHSDLLASLGPPTNFQWLQYRCTLVKSVRTNDFTSSSTLLCTVVRGSDHHSCVKNLSSSKNEGIEVRVNKNNPAVKILTCLLVAFLLAQSKKIGGKQYLTRENLCRREDLRCHIISDTLLNPNAWNNFYQKQSNILTKNQTG